MHTGAATAFTRFPPPIDALTLALSLVAILALGCGGVAPEPGPGVPSSSSPGDAATSTGSGTSSAPADPCTIKSATPVVSFPMGCGYIFELNGAFNQCAGYTTGLAPLAQAECASLCPVVDGRQAFTCGDGDEQATPSPTSTLLYCDYLGCG